jgi:lipoprotein-anchoring transpeptidase ErfK/SrfK
MTKPGPFRAGPGWLALAITAVILLGFEASGLDVALAQPGATLAPYQAEETPGLVSLPASSPNPAKVYFPNFGQFVANPLLRFWRMNGRFEAFGGPMARAYVDAQGHTVQYFQKMALAYYPELAGSGYELRPYDIGRHWLESAPPAVTTAFPFATLPPQPSLPQRLYFPQTGHTLSAGFLDLYNRTGALFIWGFPLSEEYSLTTGDGLTYTAQLFERGHMLWTPTTGPFIDPNFGTQMIAFNKKVNASVELNPDPLPGQVKIPNYDTLNWEHWADINLATQSETFYEGDVPVRTNLVTTGKPGYETPTGTFYINRRVYNEHMVGGSIGAEDYYDLYNVLYTQYFTYEGHALHYAWWRSRFGVTGSHGCVNQDLESSAFAWDWLTIGSRVNIHY